MLNNHLALAGSPNRYLPSLRVLAALLLLVAATLGTGCVRGIAEGEVRKSLPRLLGAAERYEVHIGQTSDGDILRGRIHDIALRGQRVRLREGPVIHDMHVTMRDLVLDRKSHALRSVGDASFTLDILQDDLTRFISSRARTGGRIEVVLIQDRLRLVLPCQLAGPPALTRMVRPALDLSLEGELRPEGAALIRFLPTRMGVGPLTIPEPLLRTALRYANPVADLGTLPVPVRVDRLTIRPGVLHVEGHLYPVSTR